MKPRALYRRFDGHHYLNESASSGQVARLAVEQEAEVASAELRDSIKIFFLRFEQAHGLPHGLGERLQLSGYRP